MGQLQDLCGLPVAWAGCKAFTGGYDEKKLSRVTHPALCPPPPSLPPPTTHTPLSPLPPSAHSLLSITAAGMLRTPLTITPCPTNPMLH